MKTKNLYYRHVLKRTSILKSFIINLFVGIASWPRLLLEVFIRKNFGERYFSFSVAIFVGTLMALLPVAFRFGFSVLFRVRGPSGDFGMFMLDYGSWYVFVGAFLYFSYLHKKAMKRNPSVFDMGKYSLYSGDINPVFKTILKSLGMKPSIRRIECLIEPALFFIGGFILMMLGQSIGTLILVCSIIYGLSYLGSYYLGDSFVMDKVDEMICNEELFDAFVEGKDASETRGFRFYGHIPKDRAVRETLVGSFSEVDSEVFEVA